MASLRNLPVELHYQVLFYLVDIVDQIAAANTCPLWCKILGTKGFFEDRYQTIPRCNPGFPQIHKLLLLSSDRQISCTTRNGAVEAYGIRFLNNQNNHGRDPNSFRSWDISACSFLEEPPFRITGSGALAEPRDFHPYVEMNTWLPAGYRHYSKLYESKFIRSLVEGFILGRIRKTAILGGSDLLVETIVVKIVISAMDDLKISLSGAGPALKFTFMNVGH
ncbi:hypothetical protein TWF703_008248 [Orbilia oligospora]|uniref:F-box domain-containing protein n=1 Tax=Orbilia oligospora TaxID=2813651 RepID=A0A7C8K0X4_ORBOL|nr:hypothetical protein TWF703_008248 [Orbilia oligospora]